MLALFEFLCKRVESGPGVQLLAESADSSKYAFVLFNAATAATIATFLFITAIVSDPKLLDKTGQEVACQHHQTK